MMQLFIVGIVSMSNNSTVENGTCNNSQQSSRNQSRSTSPDLPSEDDYDKIPSDEDSKTASVKNDSVSILSESLQNVHLTGNGLSDPSHEDSNCNGSSENVHVSHADDTLVEETTETECTDVPLTPNPTTINNNQQADGLFEEISQTNFHCTNKNTGSVESNGILGFSSDSCDGTNIPRDVDKTNSDFAVVGKCNGDFSVSRSKLEHRRHSILKAMTTAAPRHKLPLGASGAASRDCSLTGCLAQFTAIEMLTGSNMLACSSCNSNVKQKNGGDVSSDGPSTVNGAGQ